MGKHEGTTGWILGRVPQLLVGNWGALGVESCLQRLTVKKGDAPLQQTSRVMGRFLIPPGLCTFWACV